MGTKTWRCLKRSGAFACYSYFIIFILSGCARTRSSQGFKLYQEGVNAMIVSHDPRGAISYFKRALRSPLDPSLRADVLNNYACACATLRQYRVAQKQWYALLKNNYYKTPEVACVNLGKLFLVGKDVAKAYVFFRRALTYAPDYVDALFCLAFLAWQRADYHEARTLINAVLARSPYHDLAHKLHSLVTR